MTRATTAGHWLLHLLQPIFPSYKTSRLLLRLSTSLLFSPSVSPKALSLSAHRLPPSSAAVALLHVPCLLCRQRCPPWAHTPLGVSFTTSCWRCGCCSYPFHTHTHIHTHIFFVAVIPLRITILRITVHLPVTHIHTFVDHRHSPLSYPLHRCALRLSTPFISIAPGRGRAARRQ